MVPVNILNIFCTPKLLELETKLLECRKYLDQGSYTERRKIAEINNLLFKIHEIKERIFKILFRIID